MIQLNGIWDERDLKLFTISFIVIAHNGSGRLIGDALYLTFKQMSTWSCWSLLYVECKGLSLLQSFSYCPDEGSYASYVAVCF